MRSDKEEKKNKQIIEVCTIKVCSTYIYDELNNKDLYPCNICDYDRSFWKDKSDQDMGLDPEWKFGPNV